MQALHGPVFKVTLPTAAAQRLPCASTTRYAHYVIIILKLEYME